MRTSPPRSLALLPLVAVVLGAGCATLPAGPSVMVLPGDRKSFEQFQVDDTICREWAARQSGTTAERAGMDATVSGAAIGTAIGAAAGAALGAAAGNPALGAAAGAGAGLLGGTAVGASRAEAAGSSIQRRYDGAYMQCMYAKGHQIPVARGALPRQAPAAAVTPPPPPVGPPPPPPGPPSAATSAPSSIPPPPPGSPPPPPPSSR